MRVEPLELPAGDSDMQVRSRVTLPGDGSCVAMGYSTYRSGQPGRACDFAVHGVDLVTTGRSRLAETFRRGGTDGVLGAPQNTDAALASPA